MEATIIREIEKKDNEEIAMLIRTVLLEFNVPKTGTAYADPQLDYMFETYSVNRSVYFVIEREGRITGGAGIMQLANDTRNICELQKMYFLPEARGLGLGRLMMEKCLRDAEIFGYENCYLETMPYMKNAQQLYLKAGFRYLSAPMGNTGHNACPVWMLKELKNKPNNKQPT